MKHCVLNIYSASVGERSIVISVCLCVCVCVHDHIFFNTARPIFTNLAVARSSSGGFVIRYVFPVILITSYLLLS